MGCMVRIQSWSSQALYAAQWPQNKKLLCTSKKPSHHQRRASWRFSTEGWSKEPEQLRAVVERLLCVFANNSPALWKRTELQHQHKRRYRLSFFFFIWLHHCLLLLWRQSGQRNRERSRRAITQWEASASRETRQGRDRGTVGGAAAAIAVSGAEVGHGGDGDSGFVNPGSGSEGAGSGFCPFCALRRCARRSWPCSSWTSSSHGSPPGTWTPWWSRTPASCPCRASPPPDPRSSCSCPARSCASVPSLTSSPWSPLPRTTRGPARPSGTPGAGRWRWGACGSWPSSWWALRLAQNWPSCW